LVLEQTDALHSETLELTSSLGYVLAENVLADEPMPPFPASIVDGYAVVAADGPGEYPVVGLVSAGNLSEIRVSSGKIAQITTGSPIPEGADAVVMVEHTEVVKSRESNSGVEIIKIKKGVTSGQFIRAIGADIKTGEIVVAKGDLIGPAEIGILASVGKQKVSVYTKPVVGILSTGDELVEPSENPTMGQIRDSNRSMLNAFVKQQNLAKVIDFGIAKDNKLSLEQLLVHALEQVDVLFTSGGVSMGELDLIKPLLMETGKIHFGRLLMKPGKPCTFATLHVKNKKN